MTLGWRRSALLAVRLAALSVPFLMRCFPLEPLKGSVLGCIRVAVWLSGITSLKNTKELFTSVSYCCVNRTECRLLGVTEEMLCLYYSLNCKLLKSGRQQLSSVVVTVLLSVVSVEF